MSLTSYPPPGELDKPMVDMGAPVASDEKLAADVKSGTDPAAGLALLVVVFGWKPRV